MSDSTPFAKKARREILDRDAAKLLQMILATRRSSDLVRMCSDLNRWVETGLSSTHKARSGRMRKRPSGAADLLRYQAFVGESYRRHIEAQGDQVPWTAPTRIEFLKVLQRRDGHSQAAIENPEGQLAKERNSRQARMSEALRAPAGTADWREAFPS